MNHANYLRHFISNIHLHLLTWHFERKVVLRYGPFQVKRTIVIIIGTIRDRSKKVNDEVICYSLGFFLRVDGGLVSERGASLAR